ncbi:MAG TPA: ATP-binding protein [Candidatus Acidoferrales bacterium]|nr:ATP-binding protein [Candidatus Acidoferrales bacterium]
MLLFRILAEQSNLVTLLLDKLPTILILAVLVAIFVSLRKHSPSERTKLWIFAWALIFVHFFVQIFETHTGVLENIFESIDLGALELSGVVFLVSLARSAEDYIRRRVLLAMLIPAAAFHAAAITFGWQNRLALCAALGIFFFGLAGFALFAHEKISRFNFILAVSLIGTGSWAEFAQWRGDPNPGVIMILTLTFAISGFLFWKRFPRYSPGVITVTAGFLCWGAVFPTGALMDHFLPHLRINPEIWNVPKFFVAFGMILSVLEEKSLLVEESSAREHTENALLLRFSRITSRLLGGSEPAALCGEIAEAITETVSFRRAAVMLAQEDGSLLLAGSSGFSDADRRDLQRMAGRWNLGRMGELCAAGELIGNNSFRLPSARVPAFNGSAHPETIVPLVSSRGTCLGWIALSSLRNSIEPSTPEIMKVEMLAADLAVTIENTRLHVQLMRSEKLAALGQLVAGVAHELNNPLTGIIGYAELLSDEVKGESATKKVVKLGNEARRMHRIVGGLLRFARQSNSTERAADFETSLRDALQLREFHLRKLNTEIHTEIEASLPPLAIGEDELKQILLNLLNNSCDALEESRERSIRIHAKKRGGRIVFGFDDSGPGFLELNRAFDPFYTTKAVGKGTGLGLSICYGIIRECGGDIHLANRQPYGASVTVEVPVATARVIIPASTQAPNSSSF